MGVRADDLTPDEQAMGEETVRRLAAGLDRPFVPAWVMEAIDYPDCPSCGEPIATPGRTQHVICALAHDDEATA